jgi:hypothetical protein
MVKSFFEHVADQYPPEIRAKKYEYWQKLRLAQHDYAKSTGNPSTDDFCKWMQDRWGLAIEIVDGGYSPYYNIIDENKYLLFKIKYG